MSPLSRGDRLLITHSPTRTLPSWLDYLRFPVRPVAVCHDMTSSPLAAALRIFTRGNFRLLSTRGFPLFLSVSPNYLLADRLPLQRALYGLALYGGRPACDSSVGRGMGRVLSHYPSLSNAPRPESTGGGANYRSSLPLPSRTSFGEEGRLSTRRGRLYSRLPVSAAGPSYLQVSVDEFVRILKRG